MSDMFLIPYIRSVWQMLAHRLGEAGRMGIFGAGAHTRWLLSVTSDLPRLPIKCIIDDQPEVPRIEGYDVCRPDEVDVDSLDLILVSSDRWEEELSNRAFGLWAGRIEIVRLYEGLQRGPYDKSDDRAETFRCLRQLASKKSVESRIVVIVSDQPRSREAKLGHALRETGWRPVLLHRGKPTFDTSGFFESVRRFGHEWEALRFACEFSPVVYHIMVNSDYRIASLFVRHRPGVIVVDSYDLIAGMYTNEFLATYRDFAYEIARERYCLEHADGICSRSREPEVLEDAWEYKLAPRLFLPDGCWNRVVTAEPRRERGLRVAYVGKLHLGSRYGERFAACGCNLALARALVYQGIHLHAYPSAGQIDSQDKKALVEYQELARVNPCFHLHEPLPPDRMVHELTRYDLAMSICPERVIPSGMPQGFRAEKLKHCTTNEFFDYIDAGLPILHNLSSDSLLSGMMTRHDIGIDAGAWPIEDWASRLRQIDFAPLRERVAQAREAYDVRHGAMFLTAFYKRLGENVDTMEPEPSKGFGEPSDASRRDEYRQALV